MSENAKAQMLWNGRPTLLTEATLSNLEPNEAEQAYGDTEAARDATTDSRQRSSYDQGLKLLGRVLPLSFWNSRFAIPLPAETG
jgi:hypothetical protein